MGVRWRKSKRSTLSGRNNFFNGFDLFLYLADLRMHVSNQFVLGPRKLLNTRCHFMEFFQRRILTR